MPPTRWQVLRSGVSCRPPSGPPPEALVRRALHGVPSRGGKSFGFGEKLSPPQGRPLKHSMNVPPVLHTSFPHVGPVSLSVGGGVKTEVSGCSFFAYGWKLPAYSGAVLLTVDKFSFFACTWSFFTYNLAFLLTVGAFLLTMGKCV